jgi:DNA-directed RNA polymerase subunit RPC12/RpoP
MMGLDDDGCDECIECHRRFNATEADKRPICPKCA